MGFTAPPAGTIQRAKPTNPITAFLKSIVGLFIGIIIILLIVPTILWSAESQNTAKIFSFSKQVDPASKATGYIRTMGIANSDVQTQCYQGKVGGNCLYYDYTLQELQYTVKDYCGTLKQNQVVIEKKGQQCHRDKNDEEVCEQCYTVNESNWNTIKTEEKFSPFTIGSFKVAYPENAKIIGAERYENQIDSKHKEAMSYIKDSQNLLVAGDSDGTTISDGGSKKFLLVSTKDYQGTYDTLKMQDKVVGWFLRIVAFILLLLGYTMIFGPLSVMSNIVRKIPLIGRFIDNAVGGIIFLVSFVLALVHFILLWILIMILKNIVIVAIAVIIIAGAIYAYTKFKKQAAA